jgi:hypothetical protein
VKVPAVGPVTVLTVVEVPVTVVGFVIVVEYVVEPVTVENVAVVPVETVEEVVLVVVTDVVDVADVVVVTEAAWIASTIIAQALTLVPKLTVALDSVALTTPFSAAALPPLDDVVTVPGLIIVRVVEGDDMVPAVSDVVDLSP